MGDERFGVRMNWGSFSNQNAIGVAAQVVVARDLFGSGLRFSVAGGAGFGLSQSQVGGRAGGQLTW